MPKELIHFKVAEMTASALADTRFAPCLAACPQGLLLGAVFHDALFYALFPAARPMEKLAHVLHGADGQDTHILLRAQARHVAVAPNREPAAALLVGMASHLYADAVLHPMVWHLSGDYYADRPEAQSLARRRHRALESLMDMLACPEMLGRPRYQVKHLLADLGTGLYTALPITELASLAGLSPERTETGLRSALAVFARLQRLFPIRPLASALHALAPGLPRSAREVIALFYAPRLLAQADRLRGRIRYADPVSGQKAAASLMELMTTAAERAAALCRRLEPAVFDHAEPVLPDTGPSLDSGLPGTGSRRMRHLADMPFPKVS